MIFAKKVDKSKKKTERFLQCSVFCCFPLIFSVFQRWTILKKSSLAQFGQAVEIADEGDVVYPELPIPEILQLAGRGGEGKNQPLGVERLMGKGQTTVPLGGAVFRVAHQRKTHCCHLGADLMGAAGK